MIAEVYLVSVAVDAGYLTKVAAAAAVVVEWSLIVVAVSVDAVVAVVAVVAWSLRCVVAAAVVQNVQVAVG